MFAETAKRALSEYFFPSKKGNYYAGASLDSLSLIVRSDDPPSERKRTTQKDRQAWKERPVKLSAISTSGRRVVASSSGHSALSERPDVVVSGIQDDVEKVGAR